MTLTLTSLDYYKTYYLRIAASNPYGATTTTPVATFTLASPDGFPKAYNYPNPFNPNRGGTNIVFNAPPSGGTSRPARSPDPKGDDLDQFHTWLQNLKR